MLQFTKVNVVVKVTVLLNSTYLKQVDIQLVFLLPLVSTKITQIILKRMDGTVLVSAIQDLSQLSPINLLHQLEI